MKIPPHYTITPEILDTIAKIDANRYFFLALNIPPNLKTKIQRVSLLKSSLFSARIEGNPLTLEEIKMPEDDSQKTTNQQKRIEVSNILNAINFIDREINCKNKINKTFILNLHKKIMDRLYSSPGIFREETGAIFNHDGKAVYVPLSPIRVNILIGKLLYFANSQKEKFPLINALLVHLFFEKIHPFIDGNGRVGRLLIYMILKTKQYDFGFMIPIEEYLDEHRDDYYYYLDIGLRKPEEYLLFMLNAFLIKTEEIKVTIAKEIGKKIIYLPPRQDEILNVIKDHTIVSFDFIKRRFLMVPERTLRYDLKKLNDANLIIKIGKTKGSYYRAMLDK